MVKGAGSDSGSQKLGASRHDQNKDIHRGFFSGLYAIVENISPTRKKEGTKEIRACVRREVLVIFSIVLVLYAERYVRLTERGPVLLTLWSNHTA